MGYKKLTDEKVHEICKLLCDPMYRQMDIAIDMNVQFHVVNSILWGKSYKKISSQYDFSCRLKRSYPTKIGDDVVINICEMLQDTDMPLTKVAEAANVSHTFVDRVYRGLERTHISKNYKFQERGQNSSRKIPDEVVRDICEYLLDPTLTVAEIAEVMNVSTFYVRQVYHHQIVPEIVDEYEFPERKRGKNRVTKITTTATKVEELTEDAVDEFIDNLIDELPDDLYDPNLEDFEEPVEEKDDESHDLIDDLRDLINNLKFENARLTEENEQLKTELSQSKEACSKVQESNSKLRDKMNQEAVKFRDLQEAYEELDSKCTKAEKNYKSLVDGIGDLLNQLPAPQ